MSTLSWLVLFAALAGGLYYHNMDIPPTDANQYFTDGPRAFMRAANKFRTAAENAGALYENLYIPHIKSPDGHPYFIGIASMHK